jgi:hypothetical protein
MNIYVCSHIGVSGTTDVHTKKRSDGLWEARVGIALLGGTNMDEEGFARCNSNPFHDLFYDNYASGTGKDEKTAIDNMKKDMRDISDSLWF